MPDARVDPAPRSAPLGLAGGLLQPARGTGHRDLRDRVEPARGPTEGTLACILANPPTTSGARTLARVELARTILGFRESCVANMLARPSYRTSGIGAVGAEIDGWLEARRRLEEVLMNADAVLLAYGVAAPSGQARGHFRDQVNWLQSVIAARGVRTYQVGDGPRHPSRWQRWTYRLHPDLGFPEALKLSLIEVP